MPTKVNDLKMLSLEAKREGFCLLHHGSEKKWSMIYQNPIKKHANLTDPEAVGQVLVGYLAYPNPHLKNTLPDQRFYQYAKGKKIHHAKYPDAFKSEKDYWTSGKLEISENKASYLKKIKAVKELLNAGEIYQLNYALRFRKKFEGDPYSFYLKWIESNPSRFSAFLNCGDYQILSCSPERLFKLADRKIITEPIKGTAPKSAGKKALEALMASEKEGAELDMITDLARNDVGQVCEYGTLKLKKNREVMELPNLWHTYSQVTGKISSKTSLGGVVKALFPGGSITGCPKKRAMEYIEKLEGIPRNIFTGSIGYVKKIGPGRNDIEADFNIAIRTALVKDGYIEYWAGGGIVMDSDPEAEYDECLLKAEKFLSLL